MQHAYLQHVPSGPSGRVVLVLNRRFTMKARSFIVGMGVGAAVALLFAPRSGDETREILSDKVEEGKQYAKERVRQLRNRANDTVEQGKKVVARQTKAMAAAAGAAGDTYARESQTNGS